MFCSLVLLLAVLAPTFAAERDLLDLVPPGVRYVQVQKPEQFRGTPLADSWGDHPLGKELPLGGVEEVVSVAGVLDEGSGSCERIGLTGGARNERFEKPSEGMVGLTGRVWFFGLAAGPIEWGSTASRWGPIPEPIGTCVAS